MKDQHRLWCTQEARLSIPEKKHPSRERQETCSPGGTIQGRGQVMKSQRRSLTEAAVAAIKEMRAVKGDKVGEGVQNAHGPWLMLTSSTMV